MSAQWKAVDRRSHYPVIGMTQGRGRIATALSRATWGDLGAVLCFLVVAVCAVLA